MNKKLLIGAALLGAGVVAYKVYKKSTTPTAPPTPSPNVGTPSQTKGQKIVNVGRKVLSYAEQLLALRKEAAARKAAKNPPKFSMTNPTYNA